MHDTLRPAVEEQSLRHLPQEKTETAKRVKSSKDGLDIAAAWAVICIFVMMTGGVVYLMAPILIPLSLAVVTGLILSVAAEKLNSLGIPPLPTALLLATAFGTGAFFVAGTLADPLMQLAADAPELVRSAVERIAPLLDRFEWLNVRAETFANGPMSLESLLENTGSILTAVSAGLAPALVQAMIFFAALVLFLSGRLKLRHMVILAFPRRRQRLATIRVMNAIDGALAFYFATASLAYGGLALVATAIAWAGGLGMPLLLWGLFVFIMSFVPFLGVAVITAALAIAGLLTYETVLAGLIPATAFLGANLVVENFVLPALMGRRLSVNAFIIFTAIIFWTWMWGAAGAMLALPLSIIGMTVAEELRPGRKTRPSLPG